MGASYFTLLLRVFNNVTTVVIMAVSAIFLIVKLGPAIL